MQLLYFDDWQNILMGVGCALYRPFFENVVLAWKFMKHTSPITKLHCKSRNVRFVPLLKRILGIEGFLCDGEETESR